MTWRSRAATVLREPLAHFLIAGALVYALLAGRAPDIGERRIVVNEEVVSRIADRFALTFRRAPTPDELDGLISDYVHDQVYYREALRLGLDKDDEVVMRRMRNKMVSIATSDAEAAEPGDAELQKLLDKDPGATRASRRSPSVSSISVPTVRRRAQQRTKRWPWRPRERMPRA